VLARLTALGSSLLFANWLLGRPPPCNAYLPTYRAINVTPVRRTISSAHTSHLELLLGLSLESDSLS
jgi:hypothetical protein